MQANEANTRTWLFDTTETPAREVCLLLQHVAGAQVQELAVLLRAAGITPEQYHVLRVLRDANTGGLACSAVAERSVSGDPDATRLLDRLEKQGWVGRVGESSDRSEVTARTRGRTIDLSNPHHGKPHHSNPHHSKPHHSKPKPQRRIIMTTYLAPEYRRKTSRFGRPSARSGPPIDWREAGDAVPAPSVGLRFTLVTLLIAAIAVLIPFVTTSRIIASLDIIITLAVSAALVAFLVHGPSRGSTSRQPAAWESRSRGSPGDSHRTDAPRV